MTYIKKKLKFSFYLLIIKGRSAGNASILAKDYVFLWHEEMENFAKGKDYEGGDGCEKK